MVVNGDSHVRPQSDPVLSLHSTNITDVDDIPRANEMAESNAWIQPQISIESVDEIVSSPPMSPPEVSLKGLEDSGSTDKKSSVTPTMRVKPTKVYPKTPPPSHKFSSQDARSSCEVDGKEESYEGEERVRNGKSESSDSNCLQINPTSMRSHSLPMGIKLNTNRFSSNSDETVDSELGSPTEKLKRLRHLAPHLHQDRLGSTGSNLSSPETSDDSSSDGAGEEDKMVTDPPEQEDDIFIDMELSEMQEQADTKLINWACTDFVPACHQLLSQCCKSEKSALVKSANIQADLRSLSNTITFFCSEQQQRLSLTPQTKPIKGVSQSSSTHTFPRPQKTPVEQGDEDNGGDRSYAVKVLRSASQSLITPLLAQAAQREGFTPDLHQAIIKALQKIAWKVEACASFNNPSHSVDIHEKIFDAKHVENVRDLMIQALPPAQPNLRIVPAPLEKSRKASLPNISPELPVVPMRRGQSMKEKLGKDVVFEVDVGPPDLQSIGEQDGDDDDDVWKEGENGGAEAEEQYGQEEEEEDSEAATTGDLPMITEEGDAEAAEQSPVKEDKSLETTPNLPRRERIATEGEADLIGKPPFLKKNNLGGSIPNLDREEEDTLNDSNASAKSERYFRPKTFRRTTISLSKKEVQTLGLTVAKRVDESILDDIRVQREQEKAHRRSVRQKNRGTKSEEKPQHQAAEGNHAPGQVLELEPRDPQPEDYGIENPEDLEKIGNRLHNTLTERFRSASTSDILECEDESAPYTSNSDRDSEVFSPQPNQRLELVPQQQKQPLLRNARPHPTVPAASSQPARRSMQVTASSCSSCDWVMVEPEKPKKQSVKGRAKATVKKSLSSSGRLAHRLLKTGLSLRSTSSPKPISKSLSAADLLDESATLHRQQAATPVDPRLSMSIATTTFPAYDMATMPKKRKNTIARLIRRGKDSRSRSFGKSDKYATGNYPTWHPEDFDFGSGHRSFAESIETVSRNAIHSMSLEGKPLLSF